MYSSTNHAVKVKVSQSCLTFCNPYSPWNSSGQKTGVGSFSFLQGIFLTQGSNPGIPHCKRILYQLNHQGSPRIPEWVAYPSSNGSSQSRNQSSNPGIKPRPPALQADSLPAELPGKPLGGRELSKDLQNKWQPVATTWKYEKIDDSNKMVNCIQRNSKLNHSKTFWPSVYTS